MHHFISLTLAEPLSCKKLSKSLLFTIYLITNSVHPILVRCDVLVKKESRKFQDSENFQRGHCSLRFKEVFCKISRNYFHKQRNCRAITWSPLSTSASKFQPIEYSRRFFSVFTYFSGIVLNFIVKI